MIFASNRLRLIWILLNILIFVECYYCYATKPEYFYLREMLGVGLFVSRGAASVLNLNCCLILLPVCRFVNSYIHFTFSLISRTVLKYWLFNVQNIHVTIAFTILIASVVHTIGHVMNAINASIYFNHRYPSINWAFYQYENPFIMIVRSVSGSSGLLMIFLLGTMSIFSIPYSRNKDYVLFSTAHYLFLPFIVLYLFHPLSEILKEQVNSTDHIPGCMPKNCTADPIFVPISVQSWKWMLPTICIYFFDLTYRIVTRNKLSYCIKQVKKLPGNVYKLTLTGPTGAKIYPAQYILLQCPKISSIEWHPFTVVSCTDDTKHTQTDITVLIRACGDWTGSLAGYLQHSIDDGIGRKSYLNRQVVPSDCKIRFLIDGGFFSPLSDILNKDVAFCVASGIGITPFASVLTYLKEFWNICEYPHRLHLVWVVPHIECLLWIDGLLNDIHDKNWKSNKPDRLEYAIFVTRGTPDIQSEIHDKVLRSRIFFEKPDWFNVLSSWHSLYLKSSYPLYICGSKRLLNGINKAVAEISEQGVVFSCIHEAFM